MQAISLGEIEVVGFTAAVEAADVAVKTADVELLGYELANGGGMVTVKVQGQVGAVRAAMAAAKEAAAKVNKVISVQIIARPSDQLGPMVDSPDTVGPDRGGTSEGAAPAPPVPAEPGGTVTIGAVPIGAVPIGAGEPLDGGSATEPTGTVTTGAPTGAGLDEPPGEAPAAPPRTPRARPATGRTPSSTKPTTGRSTPRKGEK